MTKLPLNKKIIVFYYTGVNSGLFGRGKYVSWWDIREACTRENCPNSDEHCSFDGQIFYQKKLERNL